MNDRRSERASRTEDGFGTQQFKKIPPFQWGPKGFSIG